MLYMRFAVVIGIMGLKKRVIVPRINKLPKRAVNYALILCRDFPRWARNVCVRVSVCIYAGIITFPLCLIHYFNRLLSSHAQFQKSLMFRNVKKNKSKDTIYFQQQKKNSTLNSPIKGV